MRHDTIMALARLRWPVDDETQILPIAKRGVLICHPSCCEDVSLEPVIPNLWMGYGEYSNILAVDKAAVD